MSAHPKHWAVSGPGLNAEKEETPALVLMEYGDSCTVLLVFYPNQYGIYQYSFAVIPTDSLTVRQNVLAAGLQPMQ